MAKLCPRGKAAAKRKHNKEKQYLIINKVELLKVVEM
jgi:hypothetical protein